MGCITCKSEKIARISAKCSDLCFVEYPDGTEHDGYVPDDLGFDSGYGDYVNFTLCLDCGQLQAMFPASWEPAAAEENNHE